MRRHPNLFNCSTDSVTLPVYLILSRLDEFKGRAKPLHQMPSPAGACTPRFDPRSIRLPGYLGPCTQFRSIESWWRRYFGPISSKLQYMLLGVMPPANGNNLYICNIMVSDLIWREYGANTKQIDKKLQSNAAQNLANSGKSGQVWR
ncbi:hypothetical protein B0H13DRAFT_2263370 [Mycena leptocephala]|nr:hypothetical protein B0H13DRAFT_2263370 [Mycena leptocephala]